MSNNWTSHSHAHQQPNQVGFVTSLEIPVRNSWARLKLLLQLQSVTDCLNMKLILQMCLVLLGHARVARHQHKEETFCVGSGGYFGECSDIRNCQDKSFSFSSSCGFDSVCCKRSLHGDKIHLFKENVFKLPQQKLSKVVSCGKSSLHLTSTKNAQVNRNFAKPGNFPWMVSFVYEVREDYFEFMS